MHKCGDTITCIVYRCDSGYRHDHDLTVLDVIKYEEEILGNDIGYDHSFDSLCLSLPARRCTWVTLIEEDALRYGDDVTSWKVQDALVLGNDGGDGGILIVEP